jgi:hypothetical protein
MEVDSSGSIPVQAVLKLIVDRGGAQEIENQLKNQDTAFSKVEQTVGRIGTGMEGVAKTVAELAGVAGVGALLDKFIKVETSASNVALSMGKVTGGPGAYHAIGQEMLGVQSRTGVSFAEQESALRSLSNSIGLQPRPGQAGMLAEVIAGYSKVTGMPASTLANLLGPMLQAEGRTASGSPAVLASASAYTLGEARANLTAFPGSQIESILPVVSNLTTSAALGTPGGSGKGVSVGGISSLINAISGPGSVLRQPGVAEQAAQGIGGTLQGAYQNPRVYGFLKMAGIGFKESQLGFNDPSTMEKIVREANRQYPGNTETDWKMRRLLYLELGQGEAGADALERIESATHGGSKPLHVATPQVRKEASEAHHAQTLTTPEAQISKLQGKVLGGLFEDPWVTGIAGVAGGAGLYALKKFGLSGIKGLFSGGADAAEGAADGGGAFDVLRAAQAVKAASQGAGDVAGDVAGDAASVGGDVAGVAALPLAILNGLFNTNPVGALGLSNPSGGPLAGNVSGNSRKAIEQRANAKAVEGVAAAAQRKFGSGWNTGAGRKWMEKELNNPHSHFDQETSVGIGESQTSMHPWAATHLLQQALSAGSSTAGGGGGEGQQFSEAVKKFSEAVAKMTGTHSTSYGGGAAMHNTSFMGAPAVAAMQSDVPGMVMAAFLSKGGSTTPMSAGAGTQLASYSGSASGGWNAVLEKYSGNSYGLSHVEQLAGEQSGGGAHAGDRATVEADAKKYGIPFNVLWGVYGAESSFGKAKSNFGLTGQYPGTGTSGNFGTDARMSAEDLANLAKQMHINVNVNVGGAKVEQHKAKVGGQLV